MNQQSFEFCDEVLQQCLGAEAALSLRPSPRMRRGDIEKLLSDDAEWRLLHGRRAAIEWGIRDAVDAAIASERLLVTAHGLVYFARLRTPLWRNSPRALYYLATPESLFEPIVDRVRVTPLRPGSAAAVDDRFGHDLLFAWPLDAGLRRMLDDRPVLRMESIGRP
ncbi:hypothetical protein [Nocardia vaccinii]|uniref:hypothetical protein n=1 Tax=Nocardia vaccinii TaxID=1822 RepID=UPI00082F4124|nr:hypothetical protein [Nocardia vaccinii]